jgi:hypothetical protein
MSRRARITLNPEAEIETQPKADARPAPSPERDARTHSRFAAAEAKASAPSAAAGRVLNTRTIIGAVVAGLAVISVVVLLKNRRL